MEIKVEEQKKELGEKRLSSICWDCQNAYAHKCCWFKNYTPVKDWNAHYNAKTGSYMVDKCPNFVPDIKKETDREIAKRLGINIRTYLRKKNKSIFYDLNIK